MPVDQTKNANVFPALSRDKTASANVFPVFPVGKMASANVFRLSTNFSYPEVKDATSIKCYCNDFIITPMKYFYLMDDNPHQSSRLPISESPAVYHPKRQIPVRVLPTGNNHLSNFAPNDMKFRCLS